ncbi:MAG: GNAT family N-acetyltransferase [Deltaproteobacteria bacterium]|nr:MAG: GNAT family N-acetyltransferase [Deltaproteobacteria bacterium]
MSDLTLRAAEQRDVERVGDVNFVAFYRVAVAHGLSPGIGTPAESRGYIRHLLAIDPLGGTVAEEDGEVVGLSWVHPRGPVATIGPIAVDPRVQGRGIGRRLLERAIELGGRGVPQVRLVHESFNTEALGLYLRAGFRVVVPLLDLELPAGATLPPASAPRTVVVRPATADDRVRLVARDARAFGAPRPQSIDLYLTRGRALVAESSATLAGYALGIGFRGTGYLGSASADDPALVLALVVALAAELSAKGVTVRTLVPAADRRLVEGLTGAGFRVFRACQYMVRGGGTAPPPNYVLMNGDMM